MMFRLKWMRITLIIVGGTLAGMLLLAVASLFVPSLLKTHLEDVLSQQVGRAITIGGLSFKPWTLELTAREMKVATSDGGGTQLAVPALRLDFALASVWKRAWVLEAVAIDSPSLLVTRDSTGYWDIEDMISRTSTAPKPDSEQSIDVPRFVLRNFELRSGSIHLVDHLKNATHEIEKLHLGVAYLSSLPSSRTLPAKAKLSFDLDKKNIQLNVHSTPFSRDRKTRVDLNFTRLDLERYLNYLPNNMPFQLRSGRLSVATTVVYQTGANPELAANGHLTVTQMRVGGGKTNDPPLTIEEVSVDIKQFYPYARELALARLEVRGMRWTIVRKSDGQIDPGLKVPSSTNQQLTTPSHDSAGTLATSGKSPAWKLKIEEAALTDSHVAFLDRKLAEPRLLRLLKLQAKFSDFQFPFVHTFKLSGSTVVNAGQGATGPVPEASKPAQDTPEALIQFDGAATNRNANVHVHFSALPLALAVPYFSRWIQPTVEGDAALNATVHWQAANGSQPMQFSALASHLQVDRFVLLENGKKLASIASVNANNFKLDLTSRTFEIQKVTISKPELKLVKSRSGRWMYEDWINESGPVHAALISGEQRSTTSSAWQGRLDDLKVRAGQIEFLDHTQRGPVEATLDAIDMDVRQATLLGADPTQIELSARIIAADSPTGRIHYAGALAWKPGIHLNGNLKILKFPLDRFEPYFGNYFNAHVQHAEGGFDGSVDYTAEAKGINAANFRGDIKLNNVKVSSVGGNPNLISANKTREGTRAKDLLRWTTLHASDVEVNIDKRKPTAVSIGATTLDDFYARLILYPDGRLNIQDLAKPDGKESEPIDLTTDIVQSPSASTRAPPGPIASQIRQKPSLEIGPVSVNNGQILFTDLLIKPNYSANLSKLQGTLTGFTTQTPPSGVPDMAELHISGHTARSGTLDISGMVNPLATPLVLDIHGKVSDLELPPFTPYSIKYAGYGIERGKLSMDVHYVVKPDGRITASNQIVLRQLSFGTKAANAPSSLPVKLAVALLADRHGVINLNLPVSGSLDNPTFSILSIFRQGLMNILGKAVAAPFALLSRSLHASSQTDSPPDLIPFAAGSAVLNDLAKARLTTISKILAEKKTLNLSIVGEADVQIEADGIRRIQLQKLLYETGNGQANPVPRDLTDGSSGSENQSPEDIPDALLRSALQRSDIERHGRTDVNNLSSREMEALLMAGIEVNIGEGRNLAIERAVAVREFVAAQGLSRNRLFLGPIDLHPDQDGVGKWTPQVKLKLDLR